jgi:hypothetical protein
MGAEELEDAFPNLLASGYTITSQPADVPNCIGWALRSNDLFWEPILTGFRGVYYWPPGVPRNDSVDAWVQLFRLFGYQECESTELELKAEKVAIYGGSDGEAHHVARQLRSGEWTSKLGHDEDIEHRTLDALTGVEYGTVVRILRRTFPEADNLEEAD